MSYGRWSETRSDVMDYTIGTLTPVMYVYPYKDIHCMGLEETFREKLSVTERKICVYVTGTKSHRISSCIYLRCGQKTEPSKL